MSGDNPVALGLSKRFGTKSVTYVFHTKGLEKKMELAAS